MLSDNKLAALSIAVSTLLLGACSSSAHRSNGLTLPNPSAVHEAPPPAAPPPPPPPPAAAAPALKSVYFDLDKADITPSSAGVIASWTQYLSSTGKGATVVGYADERGSAASNEVLSDKRAKAVGSALTASGIAVVYAKGGALESADNESAYAQSRRVDIVAN